MKQTTIKNVTLVLLVALGYTSLVNASFESQEIHPTYVGYVMKKNDKLLKKVKNLIKMGADLSAPQDAEKNTLLHDACSFALHTHDFSGVLMLLQNGADASIKNKDGSRPLEQFAAPQDKLPDLIKGAFEYFCTALIPFKKTGQKENDKIWQEIFMKEIAQKLGAQLISKNAVFPPKLSPLEIDYCSKSFIPANKALALINLIETYFSAYFAPGEKAESILKNDALNKLSLEFCDKTPWELFLENRYHLTPAQFEKRQLPFKLGVIMQTLNQKNHQLPLYKTAVKHQDITFPFNT